MLKQILNPTLYHGEKKKKNFFEGWYYKITDSENKYSFAFIPGIIKGKTEDEGHSFIQILDSVAHKSYYLMFPKRSFKYSHNPFLINISNNKFSLNDIKLYHNDENINIISSLKIIDKIKWPDTIINPGSMGFYNYLLFMECYSHVCCLNGSITGKLSINNKEYDFTNGKIYIEKNWGKRFPESYIWIQANNFFNKNVALTISYGKVPLWKYHFNGFLAAFLLNDNIYKFTTINRSKVNIKKNKTSIKITFEERNYLLNVETYFDDSEFLEIIGPNDGKMNRTVKESIVSITHVELIDKYKKITLFKGKSNNSGLEIMGI